MWESPIYRFNVAAGIDRDGKQLYKQVVVDVTRSAPSFDSPGKTLAKALQQALALSGVRKNNVILDVGAGKLRNAIHLLNQGYRVCAVEYEQLFSDSKPAQTALARCERATRRFSRLLFPHQFVDSRKKADLVLLINVLNVMPVHAERLKVLSLCHEQLRRNGHLFWYTQRGDRTYLPRMVPEYGVGDGYYIGRNARFKTFYREFTVGKIDEMLSAAGFKLVRPIDATSRNQARLYQRLPEAPIAGALEEKEVDEAGVVDLRIPEPTAVEPRVVRSSRAIVIGNPNPGQFALASIYQRKLQSIPSGKAHAKGYQEHVKAMMEFLFKGELKWFKIERPMFAGRRRLDVLAVNKSRSGFFHSLKVDHEKRCPYLVIECKNYRHEPVNPEFDQLGSRLGKMLGMVGVLAFRSSSRRAQVIARCADIHKNEEKLVIPLSDQDFAELLALAERDDRDGIEKYLEDIVQEILTN